MVPDFEIGKVYNQILEFDRVPCIGEEFEFGQCGYKIERIVWFPRNEKEATVHLWVRFFEECDY
ncbi:hypothetical protein H6F87_02285 [Cyanobacteria bacterium FACHB-502]|nr:hypothetical protein [Cyanobacteria bacterium FACHB-502]